MPLTIGTRIGLFEILSLLGAGGMGEVYRGRDHKLNRDVALKIVSARLADGDGLRRFLREAQSLAALNHPHIAQIYGLEDGTDVHAIVMELVDGDDLAARIAHAPISVDEALQIARQIADAIEAAHDVGIVHRDLKPANVKVRSDGTVKVLDFGLAKALDPATGLRHPAAGSDNVPTFTSPAVTQAGVILGTASYMSPEQARGKPVDKRADIWAFGAVVFEMLTGRRCFGGETVTDVLAAVLSREPDWSALPTSVPPTIAQLLRRCLDKDPRTRLRDIGEARIALTGAAPDTSIPSASGSGLSRLVPWAVAAVAVIAAGVWLVRPTSQLPPRKLELALPADGVNFALSPDGHHIAFRSHGTIGVRDLTRLENRDLAVSTPSQRSVVFWSGDGQSVGYNDSDGKLWSVPVAGGTPRFICTVPETHELMSAVWLRDGSVAFAVWQGNLYTVASSGGQPVPLLTIDREKEIDVHQMAELPDGRLLVATHLTAEGSEGPYRIEVIGSSSREMAFDGALLPMASPLNNRLLMLRVGVNPGIWAFQYTGKWPLRISDGTLVAPGVTEFSASREGSLLYALQSGAARMRELVWLDRAGQFTGQVGTAQQDLYGPALSPDERRVAFGAKSGDGQEIFVRDLTNDIQSRVTVGLEYEELPSWFAAGQRLLYSEIDARSNRIVAKNADGSGTRHEIALGLGPRLSPDGRQLIFFIAENGMRRLRYAAIGGDGTAGAPQRLIRGDPEPDIRYARFSPDGRLIVYAERLAGDPLDHLFITRFPTGEGRWQVSSDGGRSPVWSRSGDLFFASGPPKGAKQLMMVSVQSGERVSIGKPRRLFSLSEDLDFASFAPSFDVTADGKRLLFVRSRRTAGQSELRWVFVQNWLSELEH